MKSDSSPASSAMVSRKLLRFIVSSSLDHDEYADPVPDWRRCDRREHHGRRTDRLARPIPTDFGSFRLDVLAKIEQVEGSQERAGWRVGLFTILYEPRNST